MSNYCLLPHSILFKGEQRVNAVLKQKQPLEVFYKKAALKNFTIFTEKSVMEFLCNKVAGLNSCNFIEKRLQHRYTITKF